MKKLLAVTLALMMALSACGKTDTPGTTNSPVSVPLVEKEEELHVGYLNNYACSGPIAAACEEGYFTDEKLNVIVHCYDSNEYLMADLEAGAIDIACFSAIAMVDLVQSPDFQVLDMAARDNSYIIMGNLGYNVENLNDLSTQRIGSVPGTEADVMLIYSLISNNILPGVHLSYTPDEIYEQFSYLGAAAIGMPIYDYEEIFVEIRDQIITLQPEIDYPCSYVGTTEWINSHENVATRFLAAVNAGKAFCSTDTKSCYDYALSYGCEQKYIDHSVCVHFDISESPRNVQSIYEGWENVLLVAKYIEDTPLTSEYINYTLIQAGYDRYVKDFK